MKSEKKVKVNKSLVSFKDQYFKFQNFLKKKKYRYQYDETYDGYSNEQLKSYTEYDFLVLLCYTIANFIDEHITVTHQMLQVAISHKKLDEFTAILNKIKRKKSIFSPKLRRKRNTNRNNDPMSNISKYIRVMRK